MDDWEICSASISHINLSAAEQLANVVIMLASDFRWMLAGLYMADLFHA